MKPVAARGTTSQPIIRCVFPALAIAILVCLSAHAAPIWYVAADAESGGDGNSWAAAYQELQPAIDAAYTAGGGEVWVKAGHYVVDGDGPIDIREGVRVLGAFVGNEDDADLRGGQLETLIDATSDANLPDFAVSMSNNSAISNVSIVGGRSSAMLVDGALNVLIESCKISNVSSSVQGFFEVASGITVKNSSDIVLNNCTIADNAPARGFLIKDSSNVSIEGCLVLRNQGPWAAGGWVDNCDDVTFTACVFKHNVAEGGTGALGIGATGASAYSNRCRISECVFLENSGGLIDGALSLGSVNTARVDGCLFERNTAEHGGGALGTGEYDYSLDGNCYEYAAHVTNSLFIDNEVTGGDGGAIWMTGGSFFEKSGSAGEKLTLARPCSYIDDNFPGSSYTFTPALISNCTFVRNTASNLGGAIYMQTQFGEPPATNCIFWENSSPAVYSTASYDAGWTTILFSLMQDEHPGDGNFVGDPGFVDPDNDDFRLRADSVCIDAGIQTTGSSFGNVTTDIDGRERGFDGDGQGAVTANGSDYDIGAYEYMPPVYHTADPDQSWSISLTELLRVIQHFNSAGYRCATTPEATEDGYLPGDKGATTCAPHASDYNPQDWQIALGELLRLIQFYNTGGYAECEGSEDGFCVGAG